MKNYSVLVTSCDSFDDAWVPFFRLYHKYWNDTSVTTYLITEYKTFEYPGINIVNTLVSTSEHHRLTWAETVIKSLEQVHTDIVLMYMDDFFITAPVDIPFIEKAALRLQEDKNIDAIYLSANGPKDCKTFEPDETFCLVKQFSRYKVSMQACLWKKSVLLSLLKAHENAWMFEIFGTKRAHLLNLNFLRVSNNQINPIKYINTGITKGKWNPEVVEIFKKEGINVNFGKRGFFAYENKWVIKLTTLKTLIKSPIMFAYHFVILPPLSRLKYLKPSTRN